MMTRRSATRKSLAPPSSSAALLPEHGKAAGAGAARAELFFASRRRRRRNGSLLLGRRWWCVVVAAALQFMVSPSLAPAPALVVVSFLSLCPPPAGAGARPALHLVGPLSQRGAVPSLLPRGSSPRSWRSRAHRATASGAPGCTPTGASGPRCSPAGSSICATCLACRSCMSFCTTSRSRMRIRRCAAWRSRRSTVASEWARPAAPKAGASSARGRRGGGGVTPRARGGRCGDAPQRVGVGRQRVRGGARLSRTRSR